MSKTKLLVTGAVFTAVAVILQAVPVLFTEIFILVTALSALPVYMTARMDPRAGLISYFAASALILCVSIHESIFFAFANGIIGLSLGIGRYYSNSKAAVIPAAAFVLTLSLEFVDNIIGIPVFGISLSGNPLPNAAVIYLFALVYSLVCLYFADLVYRFLTRSRVI